MQKSQVALFYKRAPYSTNDYRKQIKNVGEREGRNYKSMRTIKLHTLTHYLHVARMHHFNSTISGSREGSRLISANDLHTVQQRNAHLKQILTSVQIH